MKKRIVWLAGLCGLAGGWLLVVPAASPEEELDPVKVSADTCKLVLENKFVRVIEVKIPAGAREPKHRHLPGVAVCLTNYTIEHKTFPAGQVTRADRKLGTVYWSEAVVHEVKNVGATPSHTIRVELK